MLSALAHWTSCFLNPIAHTNINLPNPNLHSDLQYMKDPNCHAAAPSKKRKAMMDFVVATVGFSHNTVFF